GAAAETADTETQKKTLVTLATNIATLAEVLHHQGKLDEAGKRYREAEELYCRIEKEKKFLRGSRGFHHCELLLDQHLFSEVIERSHENEYADRESQNYYGIGLALIARGKAILAQWYQDKTKYC